MFIFISPFIINLFIEVKRTIDTFIFKSVTNFLSSYFASHIFLGL